jgi:predicted HNH restriction endonuclease
VHRLVANGTITKAREEIKKCVVLCANCHRKHHYEEHQEKLKARKKKAKKKSSGEV